MPTHPFEGNKPVSDPEPLPCPECASTKGFEEMGPYRVHCLNCNSLLKRSEIYPDISTQEST